MLPPVSLVLFSLHTPALAEAAKRSMWCTAMAGCGVGAFHRADWVWWTMAMRIKEARGKERAKVVLKLPELNYWREAEEGD